jgi:hypothetical protein
MQWHRFWDVARKAGVATLVAVAAAITQAAPDGITLDEWLVIAGAGIVAYAGVYKIGNKPAPADPTKGS